MRWARSDRSGAGRSNRRRARRLTLDALFSWKAIVLLAGFVVAWAVLIGAWWWWSNALGLPQSEFLRGIAVGLAIASVPWMMWEVITSVDGSASWREGGLGEEMTATALRKLGPDWQFEHDLPFAAEFGDFELDVDHVAVGPFGVLVVETKSTAKEVDLTADRLTGRVQQAVRQAEENAGRVRAVLRSFPDVRVVPVVVYWGRLVAPSPIGHIRRVGEVRIVRGSDAKHWAPLVGGTYRVDAATRDAVMAKLRKVAERQRQAGPR